MDACVILGAVLAVPVVIALAANRAQRRGAARREAAPPSSPREDGAAPPAPEDAAPPEPPPMLRTTSPVRLALVRASLVALALALPALALATGSRGLPTVHVAWSVLAAHLGASVALASWLERRAVRGDGAPPGRAAALACAAGTATVLVGVAQAFHVVRTFEGGGAAALEGLQRAIDRAAAEPDVAVARAVLAFGVVAAVWGLPLAGVTRERVLPPAPAWTLGALAVIVTVPGYGLLTLAYEGADAVDGWIGGQAPADDQ